MGTAQEVIKPASGQAGVRRDAKAATDGVSPAADVAAVSPLAHRVVRTPWR